METVTLKLDGKNKTFFIEDRHYSNPLNGYTLRRLHNGKKIFFAAFDANRTYLDGSLTPNGINHAGHLLIALNK